MKIIILFFSVFGLLLLSCTDVESDTSEKENTRDIISDTTSQKEKPAEVVEEIDYSILTVCDCNVKIGEYMNRVGNGEEVGDLFQKLQDACGKLSQEIGKENYEAMQMECETVIRLKDSLDITNYTVCQCKEDIKEWFAYVSGETKVEPQNESANDMCMLLKHHLGFNEYASQMDACK